MHPPSAGIYTAANVRALDRCAIERFDVPGYELMTRAGHATLNALRRAWPEAQHNQHQRSLLAVQAKQWSDRVLDLQ
jgi:NAD(P)H-hydrate repair Nnr-like enzyme with NAD(P)H-hydrate epimerase domain